MDISKIGYIYKKGNDYKVLNHEDSKEKHYQLINFGWKHIETIDVFIWIESKLKNEKI